MEDSNVKITGKDLFILIIRYLLCLLFPPLAVIDKGCGSVCLVFLFTLFGWLPGTILAFLLHPGEKLLFTAEALIFHCFRCKIFRKRGSSYTTNITTGK